MSSKSFLLILRRLEYPSQLSHSFRLVSSSFAFISGEALLYWISLPAPCFLVFLRYLPSAPLAD